MTRAAPGIARTTTVRFGTWSLAAGTVLCVLALYRFRLTSTEGVLLPAPGVASSASMAGQRPPREVVLDMGTAQAQPALASGFGTAELVDGRSVVRTTDARAEVAVALAPSGAPAELGVWVKSASGSPETLHLRANGVELPSLSIDREFCYRRVTVPPASLVSGHNRLELFASRPVLLDLLQVEQHAARALVDFGSLDARPALVKGFGADEQFDGRSVLRGVGQTAELVLPLQPLGADYSLAAIGSERSGASNAGVISVFVNEVGVGTLDWSEAWRASIVKVPRVHLRAGPNRIAFATPSGAQVLFERMALAPVREAVYLDMGSGWARSQLDGGFSIDEPLECGQGVWSDDETSRVRVSLAPVPSDYRLTVRAHALAPLAPLQVVVRVNEQSVGSLQLGPAFSFVSLDVPRGHLKPGENSLEFSYSATRKPNTFLSGSSDARDLAARFDWLELVPRS